MSENLDDYCEMHKCHPTECRGRHAAIEAGGYHRPPFGWTQMEYKEPPPLSQGLWQLIEHDPDIKFRIDQDTERAREFEREEYLRQPPLTAEQMEAAQRYLEERFGEPCEEGDTDERDESLWS